jgi:hypothetical protein
MVPGTMIPGTMILGTMILGTHGGAKLSVYGLRAPLSVSLCIDPRSSFFSDPPIPRWKSGPLRAALGQKKSLFLAPQARAQSQRSAGSNRKK